MNTIKHCLEEATSALDTSSPSARIDAEVLLCEVLECNSAHLTAWPEKELSTLQLDNYRQLVERRERGIPIAQIIGRKEFWSLELNITEDTLIPRPETELLVESVLQQFEQEELLNVIDLGTGSGAIAIAIAHSKPGWKITASDRSQKSLDVAKQNATELSLDNINFIRSDWFDSIDETGFDIIISNPPYISVNDPHLSEGDVRFEPREALVSGPEGMNDIEKIARQSKSYIKDGGWLFLEHGYDQKFAVYDCLENYGYTNIEQSEDYAGLPRMSKGQHLAQR